MAASELTHIAGQDVEGDAQRLRDIQNLDEVEPPLALGELRLAHSGIASRSRQCFDEPLVTCVLDGLGLKVWSPGPPQDPLGARSNVLNNNLLEGHETRAAGPPRR